MARRLLRETRVSGEDWPGAATESGDRAPPPAPKVLPPARPRAHRGGPMRRKFAVSVEVITPILGGGAQARELDVIDVIRPAAVRGHLRFWWRALYGHEDRFASAEALYAAESALWGRPARGKDGGRSAVEVQVNILQRGRIDNSAIHPANTHGAYAMWPAREEKRKNIPTACRWSPGTRFQLTFLVAGDDKIEAEVREVVRTWLVFGGYGGRTRRGLGSFRVLDDDRGWLPPEGTSDAFQACFGRNIFFPPARSAGDTPWLAGAALHLGRTDTDAERAWMAALEWLKEFRQGTGGARQPGTGDRPSISNWPEADKVRRLSQPKKAKRWAHEPRHDENPVWPRAAFGLPIIGQFQDRSRQARPGWREGDREPRNLRWHELPSNHRNHGDEPDPFEIGWQSHDERGRPVLQERLASPLIVKAVPLAGGKFVPGALWLNRAYPKHGEVILVRKQGADVRGAVPRSAARFDLLTAPNDEALFAPLKDKTSLRDAFLDWLHTTYETTRVAP